MVAYLGEAEATLSSVVLEPEHSLMVQSYAPKEMMSGVVNADGFGVGWYVPWSGEEPAVYRTDNPLWSDRSFASIAPKIRARKILAAVRSATQGLPVEESGVPPFASGPFLFAHNGAIEGFRRSAMRRLRESMSDESYASILGATDSETIFAVLLDRLREESEDLAEATAQALRHIVGLCAGLGVRATLNLAATDGEGMVFARYSTEGPGNSLYFVEDGAAFPRAIVVASERLDKDAGWREVPDRHLLVVEERGASVRPLRVGSLPENV
jgi:gamma-glutamyl hercynylcysteine S-oxide hydrolase